MRAPKVIIVAAALACALSSCARDDNAASGAQSHESDLLPMKSCPAESTETLGDGDPIRLGTTIAQSGPIAVVDNMAKGMNAAFKQANADGGVDGHDIELVVKDDAFETARAVTNVKELSEGDQVMAVVGQVGTASVAATQPFVERTCTPQLWVSSGVPELAADPEAHPWTTSTLLPYPTEAELWVKALAESNPDGGRIVLVAAADDRAEVFEKSVRDAIEGTDYELVGVEKVDGAAANVDAQVNATLAKKPDVVLGATDTSKCPSLMTGLRRGGYDGTILLNSTCGAMTANFVPAGKAADGAMVLTFTTDPGNPAAADDPDLVAYKKVVSSNEPGADLDSSYTAAGYQIGMLTIQTLRDAAERDGGLTRANIMEAAWTVDTEVPLSPEGATAHLDGVADPLWRDEVTLMRYDSARGLEQVGDVISVER